MEVAQNKKKRNTDQEDWKFINFLLMLSVMTIVMVLLLYLLCLAKGVCIFTRSPLLWVFETLSFLCYHVHLPHLFEQKITDSSGERTRLLLSLDLDLE